MEILLEDKIEAVLMFLFYHDIHDLFSPLHLMLFILYKFILSNSNKEEIKLLIVLLNIQVIISLIAN